MLGDLGKLIVAKGFKSCPKLKKSPDLVTLVITRLQVPTLVVLTSITAILTNNLGTFWVK